MSLIVEAQAVAEAGQKVQLVDGRWYLPSSSQSAAEFYQAGHIAGARFFDIDAIALPVDLPHMLPTESIFAEHMARLRLDHHQPIRIYDQVGMFSAPRVWWSFKTMGFEDVAVIAGGMPALEAAGMAVVSGETQSQAVAGHADSSPKCRFYSRRWISGSSLLKSLDQYLVIDARSSGRYRGIEPEPRGSLRCGHIPSSINIPYTAIVSEGQLLPVSRLREIFAEVTVQGKPVVVTCGSGVTASILALGIEHSGLGIARVYDGSWAEWNADERYPIAQG